MGLLDYADNLQPVGWLGVIITLSTVFAIAFKAGRFLVRLLMKTSQFLDDWQGEPARAGVPQRLGILERLSRVEGQLVTNGGTSLKDQTNRIEQSLEGLNVQFTEHVRATSDTRH